MAATTTSSFLLRAGLPVAAAQPLPYAARMRRIDRSAGRALEILSHAIEYLADEYVHHGGRLAGSEAEVKAMQILMMLNREIYAACPEVPTFGERCTALLRRMRN